MKIDIMTRFYESSIVIDTPCKDEISHWTQYRMMATDKISGKIIPYLLDFMKYGRLWITDIYPEIWANEKDRMTRFTSHEGIIIDFRKISNTSVYLFLRDFKNINEVMVISGSFQINENKDGESRKLGLYRYFFSRLRNILNFKIIEVPCMNAFFIIHPECNINDKEFINEYRIFRNRRIS